MLSAVIPSVTFKLIMPSVVMQDVVTLKVVAPPLSYSLNSWKCFVWVRFMLRLRCQILDFFRIFRFNCPVLVTHMGGAGWGRILESYSEHSIFFITYDLAQ
jgi:hypothetical protein